MSGGSEEHEDREDTQPGENTGAEPPEGAREPDAAGPDCPDVLDTVGDTETQADETNAAEGCTFIETDEPEAVQESGSQADLPSDGEQLRESQGTENVRKSTATVKVVLVPGGHVMTVAFVIGLSIRELKHHLASELKVPPEVLQLSLDGTAVNDWQSLMQLGVRPHGSTRLEMSSTNPIRHPLRLVRRHDNMPDVITVRVQTEDKVFQQVVVEIERSRQQKAFLGGYKHRVTGVVYHHAAVQTLPKRRPDRGVAVLSRDTQTVELKCQAQQCPASVSTQMTGIGCYVSCVKDKLVTPGNYFSADDYHDKRLRAVIRLQSFVRRFLAQQRVARLRSERNRRLAWLDLQERRRSEEKEEQLRDRRERWMNPQRREDFNLLYHALEKWRCEEEQQINSLLRGAERKAALCSLLEQETQLIAAIGRHRIVVQHNNHDQTIRDFLDKSAAPHRWRSAKGRLIEMDSPHTIRARELRDLYDSISTSTGSQDERQQVLMRLKHTVEEHKCQLSRDMVELIDREVDLMTRGLKASSLEGLRKRISTLFLQFIKTPDFNPEVAKHLKVPQNPSQLRNNMFLCRSCQRYLRSMDFSPAAGARRSGRCKDCTRLDNIARARTDFSCYKYILQRLRDDERQLNKEAKIPILLQVEDVQYLVEVVWASRSALQGSSDIYNLVFVRWEQNVAWSPWNCILLSKEETSAHLEVQDVHKTYEATFIRRIEHKHMLARRHFSQIPIMAEFLDSQPDVVLGQIVTKFMTKPTGNQATDTKPASSH